MGVQLNIKDAETVRMARELANATGQSVTAAIKAALKTEIDKREADVQSKLARIKALATEFRRNMPPEWHGKTSKEIMDSLYNADGSFAE